jgi:hypothetical protein
MKNSNRTKILGVILIGLLVLAYKTMFVSDETDLLIDQEIAVGGRIESILNQVESINFDTSALTQFKSLKSIETPLISLPVGRKNPFAN